MDDSFIRERISYLRAQKGVSEYKMSLDLGHSKGYIQSISSGKSLPSVTELFYICEYLGVTPKAFFDEESDVPQMVQHVHDLARDMSEKDLQVLIHVAERLKEKDM